MRKVQLPYEADSEGVRYEGEPLSGLRLGAGRAEVLGNPKAIGRPREECEWFRLVLTWPIWLKDHRRRGAKRPA